MGIDTKQTPDEVIALIQSHTYTVAEAATVLASEGTLATHSDLASLATDVIAVAEDVSLQETRITTVEQQQANLNTSGALTLSFTGSLNVGSTEVDLTNQSLTVGYHNLNSSIISYDTVNHKIQVHTDKQLNLSIRVVLNGSISGSSGTDSEVIAAIRRVDNSLVNKVGWVKGINSQLEGRGLNILTYCWPATDGADPFRTDGFKLFLQSPENSLTLTSYTLLILVNT